MAGYWFKVYTEILDDPKYCSYTPNAIAGTVLLMAVAKKIQSGPVSDGKLPGLDGIVFHSRRSAKFWRPVIEELLTKVDSSDPESEPFLQEEDGALIIRNFYERQKPSDAAERSREYRKRKTKSDTKQTKPSREPSRKVMEKQKQIADAETEEERDQETDAEDQDDDGVLTDRLLTEFEKASKLTRPDDPEKLQEWIDTLLLMEKNGVTFSIMSQACREITESGNYKIVAPKSIKRPCEIVMSRRERRDNPSRESEFSHLFEH
jgi:hypothetical protein